jgi:hypothetical protein
MLGKELPHLGCDRVDSLIPAPGQALVHEALHLRRVEIGRQERQPAGFPDRERVLAARERLVDRRHGPRHGGHLGPGSHALLFLRLGRVVTEAQDVQAVPVGEAPEEVVGAQAAASNRRARQFRREDQHLHAIPAFSRSRPRTPS